jgi:hypothetical protein
VTLTSVSTIAASVPMKCTRRMTGVNELPLNGPARIVLVTVVDRLSGWKDNAEDVGQRAVGLVFNPLGFPVAGVPSGGKTRNGIAQRLIVGRSSLRRQWGGGTRGTAREQG